MSSLLAGEGARPRKPVQHVPAQLYQRVALASQRIVIATDEVVAAPCRLYLGWRNAGQATTGEFSLLIGPSATLVPGGGIEE
jgi:hypothetical protein